MFNTTHTLVGLALARSGLDRWNRHAAWTAVIASNLPDLDIVARVGGLAAYIEYHRGITHAIVAIPVLSLMLAAVMYRFSGDFRRTFVVALLAMSTHPLLDYLNTYGVRPWMPFNSTWFYGDALFIIDPLFDGVLIAALLAAKLAPARRSQMALAGLTVVALYVGVRIEMRNMARSHLMEFQKAGVSPMVFDPFRWVGFIDTPEDISVVWINAFSGIRSGPDRIPKPPVTEAATWASQTRTGAAFFRFARFPVTKVQRVGSGYSVVFYDLRYYSGPGTAFGARIELDPEFRVINESLSFTQRLD